jgi:4-hydroxybenzoate polyprenyltransferase
MSVRDWLVLTRPSNLPTVWSNILAGAVIGAGASAALDTSRLLLLAVAGSIFYSAGMILNDAFDREIDRQTRPDRPIPAGRISAPTAFLVGFLGLGLAIAMAAASSMSSRTSTLFAGILLAGAIVAYDIRHKKNPVAPFIMGICRALLYALAAVCFNPNTTEALGRIALPAAVLLGWVVGLTFVARAEGRGAKTPPIALLIAGISLVDALSLGVAGAPFLLVAGAATCAPLTLLLQKWVRGT